MNVLLVSLLALVLILSVCVVALLTHRPQPASLGSELQQQLSQLNQQTVHTVLQQLNSQRESQERSAGALVHTLRELQTKVATLEEGNKRVLDMSEGIRELQGILKAPKLRGTQGELWLEELLTQVLPKGSVQMQHKFRTGDIADALITLRDGFSVAVDAKFSLENFNRMLQVENEVERQAYAKALSQDIKRRIDEISKKYLRPDEGTLDIAFMYVPAESVYYHAFVEQLAGSNLMQYAHEHKVVPVSPATLYPFLQVVLQGLRGLQIEEQAKELQKGLSGVATDIRSFAEDYRKVGQHLSNASKSYEGSQRRLSRVATKVETLSLADGTEAPILLEEGE